MMKGLMMDQSLLVKSIIEFAEKVNPDVEIVSVTADNPRHRYTYKEAFQRARQLANVIDGWNLSQGDRIATLAWNDYRHFEAYYAISCSGYVSHTINPRLFPEQVEYIINHAEDQWVFTDRDFVPLLEQIAGGCQMLTLGQYLQPSPEHLPVERYVRPEEFEAHAKRARALGFDDVAAGPLVRSSYHAEQLAGRGPGLAG